MGFRQWVSKSESTCPGDWWGLDVCVGRSRTWSNKSLVQQWIGVGFKSYKAPPSSLTWGLKWGCVVSPLERCSFPVLECMGFIMLSGSGLSSRNEKLADSRETPPLQCLYFTSSSNSRFCQHSPYLSGAGVPSVTKLIRELPELHSWNYSWGKALFLSSLPSELPTEIPQAQSAVRKWSKRQAGALGNNSLK